MYETTDAAWHAGSDEANGKVPSQHKFGELLYTIEMHSWVNALAWHPGGRVLAAVTHDCSVHLIQPLQDGTCLA